MAKKKRRISVQAAKAKARRQQNEVAECISKVLDIPVEKDGDIEGRQMGQSGPDVILRGKAKELFDFNIECKDWDRWDMQKFIEHAQSQATDDRDWILVIKRTHRSPKERIPNIVVMDMNRWFKMFQELHELRLFYEKWGKEENA